MNSYDVLIIGSGLSGLVCANILAREGMKVGVVEKQQKPGGNLLDFKKTGFRFDTGIHYVGATDPGQPLRSILKYLKVFDHLITVPLDPKGFDIICIRNQEIPVPAGIDAFRESLLEWFPGGNQAVEKYAGLLREGIRRFPLYTLQPGLGEWPPPYSMTGIGDYLDEIGSRVRSINQKVSLPGFLGGNNFLYGGYRNTPLSTTLLINHSFLSGPCRIAGGSSTLAVLLTNALIAMGGGLITGKTITEIAPCNNGFTLRSDPKSEWKAKYIISTIHPRNTNALLPERSLPRAYSNRINSLPDSCGAFILFIGLKPDRYPYPNCNYYYHKSDDPWFNEPSRTDDWPHMFLLTSGCDSPGQPFASTLTVMTFMDFSMVARWKDTITGRRGEEYEQFKESMKEKLLSLVVRRFPGLPSAIDRIWASTPLTNRDYTGAPGGSLYGIRKSADIAQASFIHHRTRIPGLYLAGQSTHTHGAVGVAIGAVATCGEILGTNYLLSKIRNDG